MKAFVVAVLSVLIFACLTLSLESAACYRRIDHLERKISFQKHKIKIKDRLINDQRDKIMILSNQ